MAAHWIKRDAATARLSTVGQGLGRHQPEAPEETEAETGLWMDGADGG